MTPQSAPSASAPSSASASEPSFDQLVALATQLAEADEKLLFELVAARRDLGLSQQDVADRLGIKQPSVAKFERHDSDPRLSTIRRYALAVGVRVEHSVSRDAFGQGWTTMSGNHSSFSVEEMPSLPQVAIPTAATGSLTQFGLAA